MEGLRGLNMFDGYCQKMRMHHIQPLASPFHRDLRDVAQSSNALSVSPTDPAFFCEQTHEAKEAKSLSCYEADTHTCEAGAVDT